MLSGEPHFKNRPQETLKKRHLSLSGPGASIWHVSAGHVGRSRLSAKRGREREREKADLGHIILLGSVGGVFGVPVLRLNWSIQTQSMGFCEAPWGLIEGGIKGRCWVAGETVNLRGCWGVTSGSCIDL